MPSVAELAKLGVARVSVGSGAARAAYALAAATAEELLGPGTYELLHERTPPGDLNALLGA